MHTINTSEEAIERLQVELPIIRKVAGWSQGDLAKLLNMSKQNVSNIEHRTIKLYIGNYIAIRYFYDELSNTKGPNEKEMMDHVIKVLVDEGRERLK